MKYDCHVFVCANQKTEGKKCCGEERGMDAVKTLRELVRKVNPDLKIRIQRAGCLDVCSRGPAMVVYPEGCFYRYETHDDLIEIAEKQLLQGKQVKNLLITDDN